MILCYSGGASSENSPGPGQGPENVCQVLGTKVKFEANFSGSSKYGISVLYSNIQTRD